MLEETGIDVINKKVKIHYLGKHYAQISQVQNCDIFMELIYLN